MSKLKSLPERISDWAQQELANTPTIKQQILDAQKDGNTADPLWKKEFMELLDQKIKLRPLELRLCATIAAFIRDQKV